MSFRGSEIKGSLQWTKMLATRLFLQWEGLWLGVALTAAKIVSPNSQIMYNLNQNLTIQSDYLGSCECQIEWSDDIDN